MALSDLAVRKAKARGTAYRLSDERGLYLLVRPDGTRWWRLDFTLNQKRRTMSLGVYPDVGLADARAQRDRLRKLVAAGIDPVRQRRTGAGEDAAAFKTVALRWLAAMRKAKVWDERSHRIKRNRFEQYIFPEIGHKDIRTIEPTEMLRVIRKIEEHGAVEVPWRLNSDCGKIFRFAIAEGWETRDPTADIKDAMLKQPPVKHHAFIRPSNMGEFLVKLYDEESEDQEAKDALLFTILTAARTVETRFATRAEFEQMDTDRPQWRVPKERMKMEREHVVPLSRQAAEIVRRRLLDDRTLLFQRGTRSGVISENTMLYTLYRFGYHSRATVHGFRRTFSTLANEAIKTVDGEDARMWEPDWIERSLAHVEGNKVRGAYNAAEYLPQRRRLLQWWADWLDEQLELARSSG